MGIFLKIYSEVVKNRKEKKVEKIEKKEKKNHIKKNNIYRYMADKNMTDTDKTILNLKMISNIKANDKIYLEDSLVHVDSPALLQGVFRWFHDYNRNTTMTELNDIAENVIEITDSILNIKTPTKEDNALCQKLLIEITGAISGLSNLKITYSDDNFITAKLDMIKDKMRERKEKIITQMTVTFEN